jgi:integration host factor subunit beta
MNKVQLIQALKDATDLSKSEAAAVVDIFFNGMADALAKGDRVEIRGLCSFFVKEYKSYTGRNPKTGEGIEGAGGLMKPERVYLIDLGHHQYAIIFAILAKKTVLKTMLYWGVPYAHPNGRSLSAILQVF